MTILTPDDFRENSLNEVCIDLDLTTDEADDATLAAAIARLTTRMNRWCRDRFEATTGALEIDGRGTARLMLPQRFTAVTAVKTRDQTGTLSTALDTTGYRLHSSLNAAGNDRNDGTESNLDWIDLLPYGTGLATVGIGGDAYCWPYGAGSVQVTGTYGWTTTPTDIKRALALLVWEHVKRQRGDLRGAESVQAGGTLVRFVTPNPAEGSYSGLVEADEVMASFDRHQRMAVT